MKNFRALKIHMIKKHQEDKVTLKCHLCENSNRKYVKWQGLKKHLLDYHMKKLTTKEGKMTKECQQ